MDRGEPVERQPFTVEDLFALPDDGKRYEIYGGEVYMVPPPSLGHQHVSRELEYALLRHIKAHDLGVLYHAPVALVLDETNYVEPDIIYVSREREAILTDRGIEGVPDLVVEILSPSTKRRDREIKRDIYARFGVAHYWLVDPQARTLVAYTLVEGRYHALAQHGADDTFEPALFPGLRVALSELWR